MKQIDLGDVGCTLIFNGILSALINFMGVQVALAGGSDLSIGLLRFSFVLFWITWIACIIFFTNWFFNFIF